MPEEVRCARSTANEEFESPTQHFEDDDDGWRQGRDQSWWRLPGQAPCVSDWSEGSDAEESMDDEFYEALAASLG